MEKRTKYLTLLFIISWLGILVLAVFAISLKMQNLWLKDVIKNSEYSFAASNQFLNEYKNSRLNEKIFSQKAIEYFEWQFVLKEQAKSVGKRLSDSIKLVNTEKNKNQLSNLLYYNLGLNNMMILNFSGAAKSFQEALKYDAKDAMSYYNLAMLYSTYFKSLDKAIKYYNLYLKIIPDGAQKDLIKDRVKELNNTLELKKIESTEIINE